MCVEELDQMSFSIFLFDFEKAVICLNFMICAVEYMRLPASQYSVLDAERIERVNDDTFRCYVYRFRFFNFEICPVLLVKVEEQPDGCCIKLLSCKVSNLFECVAEFSFLLCSFVSLFWLFALTIGDSSRDHQWLLHRTTSLMVSFAKCMSNVYSFRLWCGC